MQANTTFRPHPWMTPPATLSEAVANAQSVLGLPAQPVAPRLPLATPVRFSNGVEGVIVQQSSCSSKRYEVAWFDRHFWQVRRRWFDREQFEVIGFKVALWLPGAGREVERAYQARAGEIMSTQQPTEAMIAEWHELYTTDDPDTGEHNWVDPDFAEKEGYLSGEELGLYRQYIAEHPTTEAAVSREAFRIASSEAALTGEPCTEGVLLTINVPDNGITARLTLNCTL